MDISPITATQTIAIAAFCVALVACIIRLSFRGWRNLTASDYAIGVATFACIPELICTIIAIDKGYGKDMSANPDIFKPLLGAWMSGTIISSSARISIACSSLYIITEPPIKWMKPFLWCIIVLQALSVLLVIGFGGTQLNCCFTSTEGCLDRKNVLVCSYIFTAFCILSDVTCTTATLLILYKANLRGLMKVAFLAMPTCIFATFCTILKIYIFTKYDWGTRDTVWVLTIVEEKVILLTACMSLFPAGKVLQCLGTRRPAGSQARRYSGRYSQESYVMSIFSGAMERG